MNRSILVIALLLSGCGAVHWRPSQVEKPEPPPPAVVTVTDSAEFAAREKFRLMADVARQVATKTRAGEFKSMADLEDFQSPLDKAAFDYSKLTAAQEARLPKDKDGYLDFIRGADGKPDFEATAKIWDETADGFDKIAKGK